MRAQHFWLQFQIQCYVDPICTMRDSNITWSAMAVPHKLCGDPNLCTSTPKHHYTGIYTLLKPMNCFPGMIDHGLTNSICLLTCFTSGTMAGSLTGTASLTLPTKSQLTAWNSTPDELNTRLSLGKGTLRWFFESQWLATHRGHHDLDD